jgi:hypothetical protein
LRKSTQHQFSRIRATVVFRCRWTEPIELLVELATAFTKGPVLANNAESCFEIAACVATGEWITLAQERRYVATELGTAVSSGLQHQQPKAWVNPQCGKLSPARAELPIGLQQTQGL